MKKLFLIFVLLILIDSIYLYFMGPLASKYISKIQGSTMQINYYGALLTYICLAASLYYFKINTVQDAFVLGIVIYGVYEGTNWATFKNWPLFMVVIDTLWGGVLLGLTTYIIKRIV
jgi:uncharacterized membrane protein